MAKEELLFLFLPFCLIRNSVFQFGNFENRKYEVYMKFRFCNEDKSKNNLFSQKSQKTKDVLNDGSCII